MHCAFYARLVLVTLTGVLNEKTMIHKSGMATCVKLLLPACSFDSFHLEIHQKIRSITRERSGRFCSHSHMVVQ